MIETSERPAEPQRERPRDWFVPAVLAGSLLLHVALVLPLLWPAGADAAKPQEIPVELVQMPPPEPPKPAAKPAAKPGEKPPAEAAAPKPPEHQAAAPAPKAAARHVAEKRDPAKPSPAKPSATRSSPTRQAAARPPAAPPQPAAKAESVAQRMEQLIGPMPAAVLPALAAGASTGDDGASYRQIVLSQVARQKKEGRRQGVPGVASVAFVLGDRGEVVACEVRRKSGDPLLDAEAMDMVRRGAPYPPPPPGAPRDYVIGLRFQAL